MMAYSCQCAHMLLLSWYAPKPNICHPAHVRPPVYCPCTTRNLPTRAINQGAGEGDGEALEGPGEAAAGAGAVTTGGAAASGGAAPAPAEIGVGPAPLGTGGAATTGAAPANAGMGAGVRVPMPPMPPATLGAAAIAAACAASAGLAAKAAWASSIAWVLLKICRGRWCIHTQSRPCKRRIGDAPAIWPATSVVVPNYFLALQWLQNSSGDTESAHWQSQNVLTGGGKSTRVTPWMTPLDANTSGATICRQEHPGQSHVTATHPKRCVVSTDLCANGSLQFM